MVPKGEGWHYLEIKGLSAFLRGVTSKQCGDFYCLNSLHIFVTKSKLESHILCDCENKDFCNTVMPSEDTKILQFDQYQKSIKHHLLYMQILNV